MQRKMSLTRCICGAESRKRDSYIELFEGTTQRLLLPSVLFGIVISKGVEGVVQSK